MTPRLSINHTQSCASCHDQTRAFADARRFSLGAEGQTGSRNAMPLFNLAWSQAFFWDGRAPTLRQQVLMPIQDHQEMNETLENVVAKLRKDEEQHKPSRRRLDRRKSRQNASRWRWSSFC
jgi:cytochrome c peroxidase